MGTEVKIAYFPLFLFPPISWWKEAIKYDLVVLVQNENWVKQSYRNRMEIYGPNNRQRLTFPIVGETKHGPIELVEFDHSHNWFTQNWRSLFTAYNKSPYFEYYKDELESLFGSGTKSLASFNLRSIDLLSQWLQLSTKFSLEEVDFTQVTPNYCTQDFRGLPELEPYYQVFEERNGFQANLSVVDLLFNLGPESGPYLESL